MNRLRDERGFMMVELLMASVMMTVALTALIGVFGANMIAMRHAAKLGTATALADAQMETFREMTSRDIGIDTSAGTISGLDSTYTGDSACSNGTSTCAGNGVATVETGPTGVSPHSCSTINGWYTNTLPCTPSRTVSSTTTPASPDGKSYRIDTYVVQLAASSTGTSTRTRKQVTVVVRDGSSLSTVLVRESSVFDCSTGVTPGSTDC